MNLTYKIMAGAIGAVVTFAVQKAVTVAWTGWTGQQPPNPNDPDVPTRVAVSWVLASGVGLAVAQLLVNRYALRRWAAATVGRAEPDPKIDVTIRH